jgi:biotin carboxylase
MHHPNSFFPLDLCSQVGGSVQLVWVVDSSTVPNGMLHLLRRLGPVVDTESQSLDDTARELTELGTQGVVSFVDDHIVDAALLAERMGLRYHTPEVARSLVNKQKQRAVLDRAGIPGPAFWSAPPGLDDARATEFADRVSYPAVVKPAEGSGSRDICLVRTREELRTVLTAGGGSGFVVEEYLEDQPGQEPWFASYLSVESVVSRGRIGHVAVTGRFPLAEPFRETGNFIPALLPADRVPTLLALVDDTIAALGITDSVIHTEIKLTPDGLRVIEVNGRLGGRPPVVLGAVSATNLFEIACRVALGEPVHVDGVVPCDGVGFWLMLHAPVAARQLVAVDGIAAAAALDGVTDVRVSRSPGLALDWREGTAGKIVTVQGVVADHAELAATVARIRAVITITTDAGQSNRCIHQGSPDGPVDLTQRVLEVPEVSAVSWDDGIDSGPERKGASWTSC